MVFIGQNGAKIGLSKEEYMKKLFVILVVAAFNSGCASFVTGFANGFNHSVNPNAESSDQQADNAQANGQQTDFSQADKWRDDMERYTNYRNAMEDTDRQAAMSGRPTAPIMDFTDWKEAYGSE